MMYHVMFSKSTGLPDQDFWCLIPGLKTAKRVNFSEINNYIGVFSATWHYLARKSNIQQACGRL